jgi:hypothetical protein
MLPADEPPGTGHGAPASEPGDPATSPAPAENAAGASGSDHGHASQRVGPRQRGELQHHGGQGESGSQTPGRRDAQSGAAGCGERGSDSEPAAGRARGRPAVGRPRARGAGAGEAEIRSGTGSGRASSRRRRNYGTAAAVIAGGRGARTRRGGGRVQQGQETLPPGCTRPSVTTARPQRAKEALSAQPRTARPDCARGRWASAPGPAQPGPRRHPPHPPAPQRQTGMAAAPRQARRRPWAETARPAPRSASPRGGRVPHPRRHHQPARRRGPTWRCSARTPWPCTPAGTPRPAPATAQHHHETPGHAALGLGAPPRRNRRGKASTAASTARRARPAPLPRRRPRQPRRPSAGHEGTPSPPPPAGRREVAPPATAALQLQALQAPSRPRTHRTARDIAGGARGKLAACSRYRLSSLSLTFITNAELLTRFKAVLSCFYGN